MEENVLSLNMEWVVQSHTEMMRLDCGGGCQNGMIETGQNVPVGGYRKVKSWQKPKAWLQHRHYGQSTQGQVCGHCRSLDVSCYPERNGQTSPKLWLREQG